MADQLQSQLKGLKGSKGCLHLISSPVVSCQSPGCSLNVFIEDDVKQRIIDPIESLPSSSPWAELPLEQWMQEPNCYGAYFWTTMAQWPSPKGVNPGVQANRVPLPIAFKVNGESLDTFPLTLADSNQFWATTLQVEHLQPSEEMVLTLSSGSEDLAGSSVSYFGRADSKGILGLYIADLKELADEQDHYLLTCQRFGQDPWPLLKCGDFQT